jgi:hypothetical protein
MSAAKGAQEMSQSGNFRDDRVISKGSQRPKPEQTTTKCRALPRQVPRISAPVCSPRAAAAILRYGERTGGR